MATIDVTREGLVLRELAPGVTLDEVRTATGAELHVPEEPKIMTIPAGVA
jgi:3-oxoacid CoA-transferase subunit B